MLHARWHLLVERLGQETMNNLMKFGIVFVLVVAAGAVVMTKRSPASSANPSPAAAAALPETATGSAGMASQTAAPAAQPATAATPRLVDLGADKCIPCKRMAPILEELKVSMAGKLQVDFIDVWKNPDAGQQYGVRVIPTQIFYDASGKELSRHEGFMPREDILARFKEHGIDLASQ